MAGWKRQKIQAAGKIRNMAGRRQVRLVPRRVQDEEGSGRKTGLRKIQNEEEGRMNKKV
jgi:hypothetical protein